MKVDVLLGLQWGDEGKGKVVDVLTPNYDVISRFQGGPNAGHTLEFNGEKYGLRLTPSGFVHTDAKLMIGAGVLVNPDVLYKEFDDLANMSEGQMHTLYNMALVDIYTNSALSNNLLDIKRDILRSRQEQGETYVLPSTRKVFSKFYSRPQEANILPEHRLLP